MLTSHLSIRCLSFPRYWIIWLSCDLITESQLLTNLVYLAFIWWDVLSNSLNIWTEKTTLTYDVCICFDFFVCRILDNMFRYVLKITNFSSGISKLLFLKRMRFFHWIIMILFLLEYFNHRTNFIFSQISLFFFMVSISLCISLSFYA